MRRGASWAGAAVILPVLFLLLGLPDATAAVTKDGSVSATKNALTLANALVNTSTFTITSASYEQASQPSGIITWSTNKRREDRHVAHQDGSKGAVVFSTGDVSRAIITGGDVLPVPPLYATQFTNSKISDSHDMMVLDMTLRAKYNGYLSTPYTFVSDEFAPSEVPGRPQTDVQQNDVWHFEVNGLHRALLWTNDICDVQGANNDEFKAGFQGNSDYYDHTYQLSTDSVRVYKDQMYRIKIRIADRGDRYGDTAVYIPLDGITVWQPRSCSSSSPCPRGKTCCGGLCVDKASSSSETFTCCGGTACYSDEESVRTCGVSSMQPTTKVCCGVGASYEKDGKQWCCPPAHTYTDGKCVGDF